MYYLCNPKSSFMFKTSKIIFIAFISMLLFNGCKGNKGSNKVYKDVVVIHALSDAKGLNPHASSDAEARKQYDNIYQGMIGYDCASMNPVPVLAKEMPIVTMLAKGMEITYEIKPEAAWENGSPVTADDYIFSLKSGVCPKVTNEHEKQDLEIVTDVKVDPTNPKKFTVVLKEQYIKYLDATGNTVRVLPEYKFDPEKVLRKYTIAQLLDSKSAANSDPKITAFADFYNGEKANRDPNYVNGSGPYKLEKWETGQRIILVKKDNWWGEKYKTTNQFFEANPKRLQFETINDFNTAITALQDEKLDEIYVTPAKDFIELDNSPKFKANFIKSEPNMLVYAYLGLNTRDKILSDIKVRQALAHLVNVDQIIEKVQYGKAERVVGPILPAKKNDYNADLKPYDFSVEKAKALLAEAGWKDSDGDGILDKVIDGKKTDFKIKYSFNQGNPTRETIGLLCQQMFKQVGIELTIGSMDWSLYQDELKKGNSQMFFGSWIQDPTPDDQKQIFHSNSRNGGSNYAGWGNSVSDALIDQIRTEMDETKRGLLNKQLQKMLYDEVPNIFLYTQNFRNCIHKRFENLHEGPVYPGFWAAGFKVKDGYKVEDDKTATAKTK